MSPNAIEKYLSGLKGAEGSFPFGPEALTFKVMGKMFALLSQMEEVQRLTVKGAPQDNELLTGQFASIVPGYHMNKRHWITIYLNGDIPDAMIRDLSNTSYRLIVAKLTKAEKARLEMLQ